MRKIQVILVILFVAVAGLFVWQRYFGGEEDTTPPVLRCDTSILEVSVNATDAELLQGVTAFDAQDGDVTDRVIVEHVSPLISSNTAQITYAVFDSAENVAKLTRTIQYTDYEKPRFSLKKPLIYDLGETITLLDRLTAMDQLDGDITKKIRLTSMNLTNNAEGVYHITVQVTNSLGDTSVLPLSVIVAHQTALTPTITLTGQLLYLDQGENFDPGAYILRVQDPGAEKTPKTSDVVIASNVDTSVPGTYEVNYLYSGASENCRAILTVVVE